MTPEKVVSIVKHSVLLSCCLPLPSTATQLQILCFKILRTISVFSTILLFLPLLYGIYLNLRDPLILAKTVCLTIALTQCIWQTLLCATQYGRLQRLIEELEDFLKEAKPEERSVLQKYIDRYCSFYTGCMMWFYATASTLVVGALVISQPFPMEAEYPFRVDYQPLKFVIFFHQSFISMQCAAQVCVNILGAILVWFATARFKMLMGEFRMAGDIQSLKRCIRKCQCIRRYATEVTLVFRLIALITIVVSGAALICCGITFLGRQPFIVNLQFFSLSCTALLEVFMCALPADHLMNMSTDVVHGAYELVWYERSLEVQKHVLYILTQQKPVTVSIGCIMPVMSLKYYCSYISNAFSMFTALRVMLGKANET